MDNPKSFQNWLPVKLISDNNKLLVEWIFLGDIRFSKPFFDENIAACKTENSNPANQITKRTTSLNFILDVAKNTNTLKPNLFIYHTSRCGSTLATQLLCLDEGNIVVSEFEMIDRILRINENGNCISAGLRKRLTESIILLAGQIRFKNQKRYIIKLDTWHFFYFKELNNLFPESKQMIFFRDPDSILSSIVKKPGIQFIPELISPLFYNLDFNFKENYNSIKYINNVLNSMYSYIEQIKIHYSTVMLHNYNDGMDEIIDKIYDFLELTPDLKLTGQVKERLLYHSKNPGFLYVNDTDIYNPLITSKTRNSFLKIEESAKKYS